LNQVGREVPVRHSAEVAWRVLLEQQELSEGVLPGQQSVGLADAIASKPAPTGFVLKRNKHCRSRLAGDDVLTGAEKLKPPIVT
jgi:hypothetical protein